MKKRLIAAAAASLFAAVAFVGTSPSITLAADTDFDSGSSARGNDWELRSDIISVRGNDWEILSDSGARGNDWEIRSDVTVRGNDWE